MHLRIIFYSIVKFIFVTLCVPSRMQLKVHRSFATNDFTRTVHALSHQKCNGFLEAVNVMTVFLFA